MVKRLHLIYSGAVQGVGFRFTAERAATVSNLAGWVKNLADGRVEVVCEGPEGALVKFVERLQEIFGAKILSVDSDWGDASGEFSGFDVRY